jgi:uncharacterized damage-inducible protein DinB
MLNPIDKQTYYNNWANRQWIDWIYTLPNSEDRLYKLINHIIKGERAWLQRIMGMEWNRDLWIIETLDELQEIVNQNRSMHLLTRMENMWRRIHIVRLNGQEYDAVINDIIAHIFSHADHHRGQLAALAAAKGFKYPITDYMTYCISNRI